MPYPVTNIFWIAGNIIFDLNTGEAKNVLMLVNREVDATVFSQLDAQNYFSFVSNRVPSVQWFLDPPRPQRPQGWVIRGMQITTPG